MAAIRPYREADLDAVAAIHEKSGFRARAVVELAQIAVAAEHRRQGIAGALIRRSARRSKRPFRRSTPAMKS